MKLRHIHSLFILILSVFILTACSSSETSGDSEKDILEALETIHSVDTSLLLELDTHSGTSGVPGSHTASISSDVTISAILDPAAYHCEYFSRIIVDGVTTREDKEYYVVPEDDAYNRYEYAAESDAWSVSKLTKAQELSLPIQTGFIYDWPTLMEGLKETNEEVEMDDEVVAVVYRGEVSADILQDLFGNNVFGSFLHSMEYLLTDDIPCQVLFDTETGMPLEMQLDISENFIVDDMDIDHGLITVKYSNFNQHEEISVPKKVSIVASNPAQEFYSSYYIWNLFLPYMNAAASTGSAGNTGLSFESSWNTFQVRIDSGMTALPLNFADLNNIGYELSSEYVSRTIEANQYEEFIPVTKGNDTLYCTFYNDQTSAQPFASCKIVALDLRAAECPSESIQMYLPGEITLNVTREALLSAYGEPDSKSSGFSADTYAWYNKGTDGVSIMQQSFTAEISPKTGKVTRMYLQNLPVTVLGVSTTSLEPIPDNSAS